MRMIRTGRTWWLRTWPGRGLAVTLLLVSVAVTASGPASADDHRDRALEAVRVENVPLALELLPPAIAAEADLEGQAKLRLLLALMYRRNGEVDRAIAELKDLSKCAPDLVVDFHVQKVSGLNVYSGLANCYKLKGDLSATIFWAETGLARRPGYDGLFTHSYFARRDLAARGELRAGPLVKCWGFFIPSRMDATGQAILVPAATLAERMGASLQGDEIQGAVTFAVEDDQSIALCTGSREASINGEATTSPVAPEMMDGEVWVPLRFVAEALGWTLYWDAGLRIAYVRKPPAYERGLTMVKEAMARERQWQDAIEPLQEALALAQTPEDRARIGLLLGEVLAWSGQPDAAIPELKRVLEYDPHLRHDYPSVKMWGLNPQVELGYAYRDKGDLNAAIAWWETYLTWRIGSPRTILNDMVARRTLADDGQLQAPPMVYRSGYGFIPSQLDGKTQRLLVPAARLGEALGAECAVSDEGSTATFARAETPTVRVRAGAAVAAVDGDDRPVEASAQVIDDELWVPLRFVVEALGHSLEWEAGPRIARVR